jgi:hypothetical protein
LSEKSTFKNRIVRYLDVDCIWLQFWWALPNYQSCQNALKAAKIARNSRIRDIIVVFFSGFEILELSRQCPVSQKAKQAWFDYSIKSRTDLKSRSIRRAHLFSIIQVNLIRNIFGILLACFKGDSLYQLWL